MDLSYGERYEALRGEVRAFLAASWPPAGARRRALPRPSSVFAFRAPRDRGGLPRAQRSRSSTAAPSRRPTRSPRR